jgi:hypothetical protein
MHEVNAAVRKKGTNSDGCTQPEDVARNTVHANTLFSSSMTQSGMFGGNQLGGMTAFVESLQKQQRLALAATPFDFEIDEEGNQTAPRFLPWFSASTNRPSF